MEVKTRLDKYDNLRGIGIFLIVLMHFNILGVLSGFPHNLMLVINLPLLFYVAGYFSKIGPDESIKSFKRLIVPYIIFYIIATIFNWIVFSKNIPFQYMFFTTTSGLWFLMA